MKKISFPIVLMLFATLAFVSCESDNALTPNPTFTGNPNDNSGSGNNGGNNGGGGSGMNFNADADIYFTGTVDGKSYSFVEGKDGYISLPITAESPGTGGNTNFLTFCGFDSEDDIFNGEDNDPSFGVEFNAVFSSPPTSGNDFEPKFGVGKNIIYGNSVSPMGPIEGVAIQYSDESGVEWSTNKGSGDQSGSTFEVTEFSSTTDTFGDEIMIIRSKFSCKLYNDNGDEITVTGGTLRGSYYATS